MLVSPSHAKLSVDTNSLVGVRARYVQPYEDNVLGGGVSILDAAIDRVERHADGALAVSLRRTDGGGDILVEADDVISATGFVAPLLDLPALGVATFGASCAAGREPLVGEQDRARDLRRRDAGPGGEGPAAPRPARELRGGPWGALQRPGAGRHIARTRFGIEPARPAIDRAHVVNWLATELADGPELFHQRGYLARLLTADPTGACATTASSRWPTSWIRAGRTRSPSPSRRTAAARSTRSCSPARAGVFSEQDRPRTRWAATTRRTPGPRRPRPSARITRA